MQWSECGRWGLGGSSHPSPITPSPSHISPSHTPPASCWQPPATAAGRCGNEPTPKTVRYMCLSFSSTVNLEYGPYGSMSVLQYDSMTVWVSVCLRSDSSTQLHSSWLPLWTSLAASTAVSSGPPAGATTTAASPLAPETRRCVCVCVCGSLCTPSYNWSSPGVAVATGRL